MSEGNSTDASQESEGRGSRRLLHYTSEPLLTVRSESQSPPHGRYDKPAGLWLSVEGEDDWFQWCEGESFGNPAAQLCYEITLAPDANVLCISTDSALLAFTAEFGFNPFEGRGDLWRGEIGGIRWEKVAERYAGIIIAPYHWKHRFSDGTRWYYGWDCASGCVWNAAAVAQITQLQTEPQPLTCKGTCRE